MTHVLVRMKGNSYFVLPRSQFEKFGGLGSQYAYPDAEVIAEGTLTEMYKWKALAEEGDDSPTAPFFGEIK